MRVTKRAGFIAVATVLLIVAVVLLRTSGVNPLVRFGGTVWIPVHASDPWVPKSVRLALGEKPPIAKAGPFAWRSLSSGFDVAEMPVLAQGTEVDRILLARVDPNRFKFVVRNEPAGDRDLDGWMRALCPALVVNGSYYAHDGTPDTPVVSDGRHLGPANYEARQGAFVATAKKAALYDLAHQDWHKLFDGADNAMVSYPLLLAADGSNRAPKNGKWLANRSFLGEDRKGRILIGTTKGAYFSLDRLADFLKVAPLGLQLALNLDGGPVACQGIDYRGFKRRTCGEWEIEVEHGQAKMLPSRMLLPGDAFGTPPMPMALAVYPRGGATGCGR
jgi:hypothetical protein